MLRVLIVDDHPVVRGGITGILTPEHGFDVVGEAADGVQALERARRLDPDVILMDLRMPKMDGVETIKALAVAGSRARVLVLTTFDTDGDVLAAIEAGATGYLLKDAPGMSCFAPSERRRAARRCCRHRWSRASWARSARPRRSRSTSGSSRCWSSSRAARRTARRRASCSSAGRR
jgi:DNA-binding NarL/FixJ family response regulator